MTAHGAAVLLRDSISATKLKDAPNSGDTIKVIAKDGRPETIGKFQCSDGMNCDVNTLSGPVPLSQVRWLSEHESTGRQIEECWKLKTFDASMLEAELKRRQLTHDGHA